MPWGKPIYGIDDWRQSLESAFQRVDIKKLEFDVSEILVFGDWAWEWHNEWSTVTRRQQGETVTNYIKGAQMFRRVANDEWRVARYIANLLPFEAPDDPQAHMDDVLATAPRT